MICDWVSEVDTLSVMIMHGAISGNLDFWRKEIIFFFLLKFR